MKNKVRETSIECYNQIKEEGLLSQKRFEVYEAIAFIGPCTASEVFKWKGLKTNQSGRFTELRDLGVIYEKGVRPCKVTGRNVTEWDLTNRLPEKRAKAKNEKGVDLIKAICPEEGFDKIIIDDGTAIAKIQDAEGDEILCAFNYDMCVEIQTEGYKYITLTLENLKVLKKLIIQAEKYYDEQPEYEDEL